jgi:hypothetical protein
LPDGLENQKIYPGTLADFPEVPVLPVSVSFLSVDTRSLGSVGSFLCREIFLPDINNPEKYVKGII